jgi:hypothetical protein
MKNLLLSPILFTILFAVTSSAEDLKITITDPTEGSKVVHREYVKGTVSDPNADVWVVIHPVETSGFWIQPPVTVKKNGTWKVKVYFGRAGMDVGKEFEIRAFANPVSSLQEGKFNNWPSAEARSDVIYVIRK